MKSSVPGQVCDNGYKHKDCIIIVASRYAAWQPTALKEVLAPRPQLLTSQTIYFHLVSTART